MLPVGIIGPGAMGGAMAANLLEHRFPVTVRDIDPARERPLRERGARVADSASALVRSVDAVFVVVVDAAQIDQVFAGPDGLLQGLAQRDDAQPAVTVFLCSTISPTDMARLADQVNAAGGQAVDAPISGGPARARDGSMSMMMAAPTAVLDAHRGLIDRVAARQFRISTRPGDGARAKLVNNLAAGGYLAIASEALALAEQVGLDPALVQKLMMASSGQSWIADDRLSRAMLDDFEPRAATRVLTKDLTLANEMAREAGIPLPVGERALASFRAACDAGHAEQDDAALWLWYRGRFRRG
ncbi:MAG: NAD(P)-dependent oxidoreductase [Burkholderiaceae bacterium]